MPEGPEIKRVVDALEKQITGRVIDRIRFGMKSLQAWEDRLAGNKVKRVASYGKAIVIHLAGGLNIYSHNQLYGRWLFCSTGQEPDTNRQLRMLIDCQGRLALLYSASDIAVLDRDGLLHHPFLRKLGPDVLRRSTTIEQVAGRLRSRKYRNRQLGSLLTDQSFVAGVGNYLRCEILYDACLHPRTRSSEMNDEAQTELAAIILRLARRSYRSGGITNDPEQAQQLLRQGATFEEARFYIFRRQGLPCYRCGELIEKFPQAGHAFYRCPACQPDPQKPGITTRGSG